MKTARIEVLALAFGAGSTAAYPASGADPKPAANAHVAMTLPAMDVPVTTSDIALGHSVGPGNSFIPHTERAGNGSHIVGSIAPAHTRRFDRHFDHDNDAEARRGQT